MTAMRTPQPFHIMVTDINHHVRDLLKRELEKDGYSVCCVKSGIDAYHSICDSAMIDVVILDPELLYPYGYSLLVEVLENNPALQIIIHTYHEFTRGLKTGTNIHIVEKNATSIHSLKETIRACLIQKAGRRPSQSATIP
jgi:DNA-binding response OmpR family regulator